ncbi:zinc ribbon domain-containing protein [Streptomyces sp. LaBMicrA B280]|uniref:zinc ribbon domain-containing protein n=1 Tax=Streptomyces sp. LaBMicrA B280 TaxID=3391001 RepID=UPI003BA5A29C
MGPYLPRCSALRRLGPTQRQAARRRGFRGQTSGTSQTCGACHARDAASRVSRDAFVCTCCGHTDNADHNASVVILDRVPAHRPRTAGHAVHSTQRQPLVGRPSPAPARARVNP